MRAWRKHIIVIIAYTLIAMVMTFPLASDFAAAIPGVEGDATSFVWALGWAKTALTDLCVNPFRSDYVFYPLGGATQLMWAVSLIAFVSMPLQYWFGLVVAHNVMYLAATVLTAYGTFLLAEYVIRVSGSRFQVPTFDGRSLPPFQTFLLFKFVTTQRVLVARRTWLAPFVAGLVFAFAPLRLGYGLAFFNLFNTQLIPFYVLFLMRATRESLWRAAVLAGALMGLNAYIDFQIAAFLALFSVLYAAYALLARECAVRAALARWVVAALVAVLVAAPLLAVVADDFATEDGNYIRVFPLPYSAERSYDLFSFLLPNARSTLYAHAPLRVAGINAGVNANDVSALSPDRQAFVGYVALALAAYAGVRRFRRARVWLIVAIGFALFSFGPSLRILGRETGIPLPYLLLNQIPIVNHIRIPMRYGLMVSFALAPLAAIALDDLWRRGTRPILRWMVLASPVFILLEYAVLPYPIQRIEIPRVYEQIAHEPGDFTILEIPTFHWRGAAATEVYQAIHGKRILRAYTNRIAPGLAEYFGTRGIPIVGRSLRVLEGAEKGPLTADEIAEDRRARDAVVRFFDLRYAVLHRLYLTPDDFGALDAYLGDVLGAREIFRDAETIAYEIPPAPRAIGALTIDLRENIGQLYAGRGWQFEYPKANWEGEFDFVWTRGAWSEIYFVADTRAERALSLHAYAATPQRVVVWLNGERIGEIARVSEWKDYRVALPARALRVGMNRVRLQYDAELQETIGVTMVTVDSEP